MAGITYDTGALIAAERADKHMWTLHNLSLKQGLVPTVPAAVLAQAWRGGPQPFMSRLLSKCRVVVLDEEQARAAGAACAAAGTSDIVDASVVVGAAERGDMVATSDQADLERLRDALRVPLTLRPV